jgi:hypothetical protein
MGTIAVATACGNRARCARCVRAKNQSGCEQQRREEDKPQERAAETSLEREGRDHGGSLREVLRKTDGAVGLGDSGQRF